MRGNVLKQCSVLITTESSCTLLCLRSWCLFLLDSSLLLSLHFIDICVFKEFQDILSCQVSAQCYVSDNTQYGGTSEPGSFTQFPHKVSWNIIRQENYNIRAFHSVSLIKDLTWSVLYWLTHSGVFDLCLHPLVSQRFQPYMRGSVQGPAALWLMLRENRGNWAWDVFKGRFIPLLCVLNPLIAQ